MLNKSKAVVASLASGAFLFAGQVYAAVPTEVTAAMSEMKTDGLAVATAFLVATIAITAFLFMRKGARA